MQSATATHAPVRGLHRPLQVTAQMRDAQGFTLELRDSSGTALPEIQHEQTTYVLGKPSQVRRGTAAARLINTLL